MVECVCVCVCVCGGVGVGGGGVDTMLRPFLHEIQTITRQSIQWTQGILFNEN